MEFRVGTKLNIKGMQCKVIGYIQYSNPEDSGKCWTEYRLSSPRGELWLSWDDIYNEFSISWPENNVRGQIGPEWHKVDEGRQVVRSSGGAVDVDFSEEASFIEYEDSAEDYILSVEIWSDGTEYSKGEYIEKTDVKVEGFESTRSIAPRNTSASRWIVIIVTLIFVIALVSIMSNGKGDRTDIQGYIAKSTTFDYVTSITGNANQKADVYSYGLFGTTDDVAKMIIDVVSGKTESVTQHDDINDEDIAILTKNEYCLIYHPEESPEEIYVQISDRKYNYTSDNTPYRSSSKTSTWYRSHYYTAGFSTDSTSFKSVDSAYTMYDGDTIHNIGNGYFDTYSKSVRQTSALSRDASSGGISNGK